MDYVDIFPRGLQMLYGNLAMKNSLLAFVQEMDKFVVWYGGMVQYPL